MAPDKIYLNKAEVEIPADIIVGMAYARLYNDFVPIEYIRKDALLEWAKEYMFGINLKILTDKLNSM